MSQAPTTAPAGPARAHTTADTDQQHRSARTRYDEHVSSLSDAAMRTLLRTFLDTPAHQRDARYQVGSQATLAEALRRGI